MFVGFSHLEICAEKNSQNVNVTRISEKPKSRSSIGAPASRLRLLLIATWGVYPISYLIPILVKNPSMHQMAYLFTDRQIGYTVADVLAKCVFGLTIFKIARMKSAAEGLVETH